MRRTRALPGEAKQSEVKAGVLGASSCSLCRDAHSWTKLWQGTAPFLPLWQQPCPQLDRGNPGQKAKLDGVDAHPREQLVGLQEVCMSPSLPLPRDPGRSSSCGWKGGEEIGSTEGGINRKLP